MENKIKNDVKKSLWIKLRYYDPFAWENSNGNFSPDWEYQLIDVKSLTDTEYEELVRFGTITFPDGIIWKLVDWNLECQLDEILLKHVDEADKEGVYFYASDFTKEEFDRLCSCGKYTDFSGVEWKIVENGRVLLPYHYLASHNAIFHE